VAETRRVSYDGRRVKQQEPQVPSDTNSGALCHQEDVETIGEHSPCKALFVRPNSEGDSLRRWRVAQRARLGF